MPVQRLTILGQQGGCLYARDGKGRLWYRIVPDGTWGLVAH